MTPRLPTRALALALLTALAGCSAPDRTPATTADQDGQHAEAGEDAHGHDTAVVVPDAIARDIGLSTAPAGPGTIADQHEVQCLLTTLETGNASVTARFPGPIRRLHAELGDVVRAGQPLATIDSNLSLSAYTVTAPIAGTVLARDAAVGQLAGEGAVLYEIADLSTLWVDLHVYGRDAEHLAPGSPVTITRLGDGATAQTRIERVLPATATASQSTVSRARLDNADGKWRPGAAVRAQVTVSLQQAALVVPLSALQRMDERDVVFVREGERYEARPVSLGRRDAQQVEILAGIAAGDDVVIAQSYTLKADLEKAGATHAH